MKKKLYKVAFISSPIMSLVASVPLVIFENIQMPRIFYLWFALACIIFVFWLVNIFILSKIADSNSSKRYVLSYLTVLIIQAINIFVIVNLDLKPNDVNAVFPLIPAIAINTLILILSNSIILQFQKESAELQIEQLKVEKLEAQKQVLIQQLQPHFLFNSLSVLKSLIQDNTEDAEDYTVKLSEFLRYSVESHQKELVNLSEELQFTKDYLELQKVRFGDSFRCSIEVPEEKYSMKIPVYALQTLVENAFKHNYFTEKNPLYVSIIYQDNHLKIENNKVKTRVAEKTSTGLNNLNKRYELIAGKHIEIKENNEIFSVIIPLI
jgi:two-component system, LytTR family, sensor kinase